MKVRPVLFILLLACLLAAACAPAGTPAPAPTAIPPTVAPPPTQAPQVLTDQTTVEAYEDELLDYLRITDKGITHLGFENLKFKGRPIMWCPSSPSAKIYFINPNYLQLMVDETLFMDMTEWKAIPDQPNDRVAQIVSTMQMVCSRPISQGILHTITY